MVAFIEVQQIPGIPTTVQHSRKKIILTILLKVFFPEYHELTQKFVRILIPATAIELEILLIDGK